MLFLTRSSLEVCATSRHTGRSLLMNVCAMHALQCIGKNLELAEDGACQRREHTATGCTNCQMWEACDGTDRQGYKLRQV